MSGRNQVSVNTMMLDSLYSWLNLLCSRSSSILLRRDRTLLKIIEGSGGLLPLLRRRCLTPPLFPLFLRLVPPADLPVSVTAAGRFGGGVSPFCRRVSRSSLVYPRCAAVPVVVVPGQLLHSSSPITKDSTNRVISTAISQLIGFPAQAEERFPVESPGSAERGEVAD